MFVKIVEGEGETIIDCDTVSFPKRGGCMVIGVDGKPETIVFGPERKDVQVYVMNNDGRTIEGRSFFEQ